MTLIKREQLTWGFLSVVTCMLPLFAFQTHWAFNAPLFPTGGDGFFIWNLLKGAIANEVKPYYAIVLTKMGAPFSPVNLSASYPITEQLQLSILWILGRFVKDPIRLGDIYFLFGYVLSSLVFYCSAIILRIRAPIAFGLSLSFTYIEFHASRYVHLFLSQYWVLAPAGAILLLSLHWKYIHRMEVLLIVIASFFVTLWHSYYGYFFVGVFNCVLFSRMVANRRSARPLFKVFLLSSLAFILALGLSTAHYFISRLSSDDLPSKFSRVYGESYLYSLRLGSALVPVLDHRLPELASIRAHYDSEPPNSLEGQTGESIGSIAVFGLGIGTISLMSSLLKRKKFDLSANAAILIFVIFVFACPNGVAGAISQVFPFFRSPNRINPMIAVMGLFAAGKYLTSIFDGETRETKIRCALLGLILGAFAIWDQVPFTPEDLSTQAELHDAKEFVGKIDEMVGEGAVLQLPIARFPEGGMISHMDDYSHIMGSLFSKKSRYSYGALNNTKAYQAISEIASKPLDIEQLKLFGYSGIWIDKFGYEDGGEYLISSLRSRLHKEPLRSNDQRRVFFSFN